VNAQNLISLDEYLVIHQIAPTLTHATRIIEQGQVSVNEQVIHSTRYPLHQEAWFFIGTDKRIYISLTDYYLEKSIRNFQLDLSGANLLYVGTNMGRMAEYALQHQARQVVYIYPGNDPLPAYYTTRQGVSVPPATGLQTLTPSLLPVSVYELIVVDVPPIIYGLVYPYLKKFLQKNGHIIAILPPAPKQVERRPSPYGIIKTEKIKLESMGLLQQHIFNHGFYVEASIEGDIQDLEKGGSYLVLLKSGS
jgi:23S rRNA (cytidine1920-2'-O)/16S rRNA (cytidine1409-2'-O)-methyltransferase